MRHRSKNRSILARAARWYVRREVEGEERARLQIGAVADMHDEPDEVAAKLQRKEGRRAALRGFLTGLGSSPHTAMALALLNLEGAASQQLNFAASVQLAYDPLFFKRDDWEVEILRAVIGAEDGGLRAGALANVALRNFVASRVKKAGVRVATNFVPIVGGLAGALAERTFLVRAARSIREQIRAEETQRGPRLVTA